MNMPDDIARFIKAVLDEQSRHEAAVEAECLRLEREGHRIVSGGQTDSYDEDNECDWEITDYRTGEILASGHGTYEDCAFASQANYWHIDHVTNSVEDEVPERPPWMSEKLTSGLQNLVWDNEDEIRALLGRFV